MGTKGLIGTLDGFLPWGMLQAVAKGAVFSWGHAQAAVLLHEVDEKILSKQQKNVLSGGLGGAVQGLIMSPLLLLKTRVMTDPSFRSSGGFAESALASARVGARVISSEGVGALMKGAGLFSAKRFADWTTRFLFVVLIEEAMRETPSAKLSDTQLVFASLAGGSLSALSTIPIDVVVATTQSAEKAGKKVSLGALLKEKLAEGGVSGSVAFATKGLVARVAHVALTTLAMKTITSKVYDILYPA